jgi:Glu-tRNA(Gln) amidotransferase subunit E-like FAD-binding protein
MGRAVDFPTAVMHELLLALRDRALAKEGLLPAMLEVARGNGFSRDALPPPCLEEELARTVSRCSADLTSPAVHNPGRKQEVLMGLVMEEVRGRIDGATVAQRIKEVYRESQT